MGMAGQNLFQLLAANLRHQWGSHARFLFRVTFLMITPILCVVVTWLVCKNFDAHPKLLEIISRGGDKINDVKNVISQDLDKMLQGQNFSKMIANGNRVEEDKDVSRGDDDDGPIGDENGRQPINMQISKERKEKRIDEKRTTDLVNITRTSKGEKNETNLGIRSSEIKPTSEVTQRGSNVPELTNQKGEKGNRSDTDEEGHLEPAFHLTSCPGNQSNGIPDTSYLYGKCIAGRHHILMYNRVPKCGSRTLLSLTEILAERYGFRKPAEIIISREKWQRLKREVPYYEIVRKRLRNTPVTSVLHGHIYFLDYSKENLLLPHKRPLYLNLIRDPFDRMVSQYYFVRFGDGKFTNLKQLHKMTHPKFINESFNECVERDRPECIGPYGQSLLVKYFCGYSPHCQDPTEEALETAKQNLDKYVVVGVAEEYEDFLKVLEKLLPDYYRGILTEFKTSTEKRNEKKMKAKKKKPVKPEVEERMKALLELDYKFYNYTRERFHELKKSLGID